MLTEPVVADSSGLVPEAGFPYPPFGPSSKKMPTIHVVSERQTANRAVSGRSAEKAALFGVDGHKTLAGGIAHNFNNLLMGINGYVELMLLKSDSSHRRGLLRIKEHIFCGSNQIQGFVQYVGDRVLLKAEPKTAGTGDPGAIKRPEGPSVRGRLQSVPEYPHDPRDTDSMEEAADDIVVDLNRVLEDIRFAAGRIRGGIAHDHPYHEPLDKIDRLLDKGKDIALQLLRCSRNANLSLRPIRLDTLVKEAMDTYGCVRKGVTVHQRFAPGLDAVVADPCQIEQILQNLFLNAVDAMPGGGDVFMEVSNAAPPCGASDRNGNGFVLIQFRDTGTGMDAATADRIFEPFFSTKGLKGRGLGLSSVHRIVSAHGGEIEVASNPGRGTTFRIYLPAAGRVGAEPPQLGAAAS